MSSNPLSQISVWCQRNSNQFPEYIFGGGVEIGWTCIVSAPWIPNDLNIISGKAKSKKVAKLDAAEKALKYLNIEEKTKLKVEEKTIFLIDGDQRVDCWKWLSSTNISWDSKLLDIIVFISPTSYSVENKDVENIIHVQKAKTTNKDSADALMLISMGRMMGLNLYKKYILISSDHILVQAADDFSDLGSEWINNLKMLKEKFT